MKTKRTFITLLTLVMLVGMMFSASIVAAGETSSNQDVAAPKYIFFLIGDGMGLSHRQLAEYYMQYKLEDNTYTLAMNDMAVTSNITTHNSYSLVTDSAAAGTALATGRKTRTGYLGIGPDGETEYQNISEALRDVGMSIGLITTMSVTHATPAAFGAHTLRRGDEDKIADQYLEYEWDFIAGGGHRYFTDATANGSREDGSILIPAFEEKGYVVNTDLESFEATDFSQVSKYLGIYERGYLTDAITQTYGEKTSPELYEMVEAGIEALSQNENGFFMMIEGGAIDTTSHNHDTPAVIYEVLAFDKAVQTALDFYAEHPDETLVIVTADHETGGLSLSYNSYGIDFAKIDEITTSFAAAIEPHYSRDDTEPFFAAIEETWHVELTEEEKEEIVRRLREIDIRDILEDMGYDTSSADMEKLESVKHMFGVMGYGASPILSRETKISWSVQTHTGEPVPLTVTGVGSEYFATCRDNTDVPNALAEIMGITLQ